MKKKALEKLADTLTDVTVKDAAGEMIASTRRNAASTIERSDRYANIENCIVPFVNDSNYSNSSASIKDAIILCQKAWYGIPIFRSTIELMVEFSINNIHLRGKNKKAKDFFKAYFNKININKLQDKFFREYYRSGNVFILRQDGDLTKQDVSNIVRVFGEENNTSTEGFKLPVQYIILNPAELEYNTAATFYSGQYFRKLTDYQIEALKNPKTKEDKELFDGLPDDVKNSIKNNRGGSVLVPIDSDKVYSVFYQKQDYEPFSVPMGYAVLSDINWKEEMKQMDMALSRTTQGSICLVTTGAEKDKGGINYQNIAALQEIFSNKSIGRTLVADYTTKVEFVIPQIADILDPRKYEIVDRDIALGLNNILIGDEKFANQSIKTQVFVEKLRQARKSFLNEFLYPEIKRISDALNFKSYIEPYFEDFDLKDEVEFARIYTRLAEIGVLTPSEAIQAINTGVLPEEEDSFESQQKYKTLRDKGLYMPPTPKQEGIDGGSGGRPSGTKRKQSTKKIKPMASDLVKDIISLKAEVQNAVQKLDERIDINATEVQKNIGEVVDNIICGAEKNNWFSCINQVLENKLNVLDEIKEIAETENISLSAAAVQYHINK